MLGVGRVGKQAGRGLCMRWLEGLRTCSSNVSSGLPADEKNAPIQAKRPI